MPPLPRNLPQNFRPPRLPADAPDGARARPRRPGQAPLRPRARTFATRIATELASTRVKPHVQTDAPPKANRPRRAPARRAVLAVV